VTVSSEDIKSSLNTYLENKAGDSRQHLLRASR